MYVKFKGSNLNLIEVFILFVINNFTKNYRFNYFSIFGE